MTPRQIALSRHAPCDYALTDTQAETLQGASLIPVDLRRKLLRRLRRDELVELFAQFIGLANSVVANNREMIELAGIISGELHPERAHEINLPTIFGALSGVKAANLVPAEAKTCGGCAYRLGTPANQSPVTTSDVDWQRGAGDDFWCHEDMNADGSPNRKCIGHLLAMKAEGPPT